MGQLRDPLVGRDLLFGIILSAFWLLLFRVSALLTLRAGDPPGLRSTDYLAGSRSTLAAWLSNIPGSIQTTLVFFFVLFILKVVLRRQWLAGAVFVAIFATVDSLSQPSLYGAIAYVGVYTIIAVVVFRFGLISLATAIFCTELLGKVPLTMDTRCRGGGKRPRLPSMPTSC